MKQKFTFITLALALATSALAQVSTSYRSTVYDTDLSRKNNEALSLMVDFASNAAPRWHWQTNLLFDVDTTAGGIAALDALAPVVSISTPRNNHPVEVERVAVIGGDVNSDVLAFDLLFCRAPITWPATNAVANLLSAELATNLYAVVRSTDGTWGAAGATNKVWTTTNVFTPRLVAPATNTVFVYAVNRGAITNTNAMRITLTLRQ